MNKWGTNLRQGISFRYLWSKLLYVSMYEIIDKINGFSIALQIEASVSCEDSLWTHLFVMTLILVSSRTLVVW